MRPKAYLSYIWNWTRGVFIDNYVNQFLHDPFLFSTSRALKLFHYPRIPGCFWHPACPCTRQGLPYCELQLYLSNLFTEATRFVISTWQLLIVINVILECWMDGLLVKWHNCQITNSDWWKDVAQLLWTLVKRNLARWQNDYNGWWRFRDCKSSHAKTNICQRYPEMVKNKQKTSWYWGHF